MLMQIQSLSYSIYLIFYGNLFLDFKWSAATSEISGEINDFRRVQVSSNEFKQFHVTLNISEDFSNFMEIPLN